MSVVAFVPRASGAHRAGFLVVVALHALVVLALLHGLARTVIENWNPPPVVQIVKPTAKPEPEPPTNLPKPTPTALPPPIFQATPEIPEPPRPQAEPAFTRSTGDPAQAAASPAGDPTGTATAPVHASPFTHRAAARPTIADVQACAPTGDDYPIAARRLEVSGTTRIRFSVNAAGVLVGSQVMRSAGPTREHKLLDRVAEGKLAGCTFAPGIDENGRAIGGTFEVDYVWKLDN